MGDEKEGNEKEGRDKMRARRRDTLQRKVIGPANQGHRYTLEL